MTRLSDRDERKVGSRGIWLTGSIVATVLGLASAGCRSAAWLPSATPKQRPSLMQADTAPLAPPNLLDQKTPSPATAPLEAPARLAAFRTIRPLLQQGPDDRTEDPSRFSIDTAAEARKATPEEVENGSSQASKTSASDEPGDTQTVQLALDPLIAEALAGHPSVLAARQRVAAAQSRIPQVTALPDPSFQNTFWPIQDHALQTAGGRVGNQMGVNQRVPWPQKLATQGAIADDEVRIARAELQTVRRDVREELVLAYVQWWLADELIQIVTETQQWAEDLVELAEANYRAGGGQQDVLRAELEVDRVADQLITLRQQRRQAFADLNRWVTLPPMSTVAPIDLVPVEVEQATLQIGRLIAVAEQSNPILQGLAAEIARDHDRQRLACLQQYPDLQFGMQWTLINDDVRAISPVANGRDNINLNVGVTLPIWREKIRAGIREAAHRRSSTLLRHEAERDRLRAALRRQIAEANAAIDQLTLFQDRMLPRTERALEIVAADYRGNRAGWNDLAALYREWLSLQVQVARSKASLAASLARIEATLGQPMPVGNKTSEPSNSKVRVADD